MVRPCTGRSRSPARLLAAVGCVVVLALTACGHSSDTRAVVPPPAGSTYTLMQMNLCLSGLGGCYGQVAYPAVVEEAVARIREAHPDAITFNEALGLAETDESEPVVVDEAHARFTGVDSGAVDLTAPIPNTPTIGVWRIDPSGHYVLVG